MSFQRQKVPVSRVCPVPVPVQKEGASLAHSESDCLDTVTQLVLSCTRLVRVRLFGQQYCVEPSKIVAKIRGVHKYTKGTMLYGRHVIPLVDSRTASECQAATYMAATLVFTVQSRPVALVVDAFPTEVQVRFSDITLATEDSIQLHPYLEGEIQIGESLLRLINMEKLLAPALKS